MLWRGSVDRPCSCSSANEMRSAEHSPLQGVSELTSPFAQEDKQCGASRQDGPQPSRSPKPALRIAVHLSARTPPHEIAALRGLFAYVDEHPKAWRYASICTSTASSSARGGCAGHVAHVGVARGDSTTGRPSTRPPVATCGSTYIDEAKLHYARPTRPLLGRSRTTRTSSIRSGRNFAYTPQRRRRDNARKHTHPGAAPALLVETGEERGQMRVLRF